MLGLGLGLALGRTNPVGSTAPSITDDFNDGVKNATLWGADGAFQGARAVNGTTVSEGSGVTTIQPPDGAVGWTGRISANAASFIGKKVVIERKNEPGGVSTVESYLRVGPDANGGYGFLSSGGNLFLQGYNAGTATTLGSSFSDPDFAGSSAPTTHHWVRLGHDNTTDEIKLDTAPSTAAVPPASGEWTNRVTIARSDTYWNKTTTPNLKAAFGGGQWSGSGTPPAVIFDNFDTDMAL